MRKKVLVSGRVQGVFYRASCRDEAESRGVSCRAENLSDGRVEVLLEGDEGAVEEVIAWCRKGPPAARVENVEVGDA